MTYSGVSPNIYLPWRGLHFNDFFPYLFQPFERADVGFAMTPLGMKTADRIA